MKLGFITNLRAPYRTLQLNEFSEIKDVEIRAYYCNDKSNNRSWKISEKINFEEFDLKGYKIFKKYGYINIGILNIVKSNDLIILGGYEQPTYIFISILCRILKKPYILLFDGISTNRINAKENFLKKFTKKIVINSSNFIMGNGIVSKRYFNEVFGYPLEKIYNQFLTVNGENISKLYMDREKYREKYREKLQINKNDKVLIYSGRLVDIKNVDSVIKAIAKIKRKDIVFLILGGGELEYRLKELSEKLGVKTIITGFIANQDELFKLYFVGDALILPSTYEPWGLVVNEAMFSGLPVLVSELCGCSMDLINDSENGYLIDPYNLEDISYKIEKLLYKSDLQVMGSKSKSIIKEWSFVNSRIELEKIIKSIYF